MNPPSAFAIKLAIFLPAFASAASATPSTADTREAAPTSLSEIEVRLSARVPTEQSGLRWSPKGATVALEVTDDGLSGEITLGLAGDGGAPIPARLRLSRSAGSKHFDQLWIDQDKDGVETTDEHHAAVVSESRGKFWSSFRATLELPLPDGTGMRPYPLSLWFVADPEEPGQAPVLRWSRRGWHQGEAMLEDTTAFILITDLRMDGLFDEADAWSLSTDARTLVSAAESRSLGRHAWLDERAYRMVAIDPHGQWIRIERFDPGITRAEEEHQEDALAMDRSAKRADKPLPFMHDFEAASAQSRADNKPLLVDFEATWCGPCKQMDRWVYTAEKVVDVARATGLLAVKVDGDERKDLKERFEVGAYPTMILISAEGVELRRCVGYQSVDDMAQFLGATSG